MQVANDNKMDSLLKLTDDIIVAVDGIMGHVTGVLDEVFEFRDEHSNTVNDDKRTGEPHTESQPSVPKE